MQPTRHPQQKNVRWLTRFSIALTLAAGFIQPTLAAQTNVVTPLRMVSTPNPNVFPLLLAMKRNPQLPVSLVPVGTGSDIVNAFSSGQGDALLSMTYTAAQDVTSGKIPQLELVSVNFWRGFWILAPKSAQISQFSQLANEGVLIAGPTAGGKGGGPDLIFQAAARQAGMGASSFNLCYLPVMQAAPMMVQQQPMNSNSACASTDSMAPTGISLVEPAATGLVMQSKMSTASNAVAINKAIDVQTLFTDYNAWPHTELPHGGMSVLAPVLDDPQRLPVVNTVLAAYRAAVQDMMAARNHPLILMLISRAIANGITTYYGQYGLSIPAPVIAMAIQSGNMVFRDDLSINAVQPDLGLFLTDVVGSAPPASFYHPL